MNFSSFYSKRYRRRGRKIHACKPIQFRPLRIFENNIMILGMRRAIVKILKTVGVSIVNRNTRTRIIIMIMGTHMMIMRIHIIILE